MDHRADEPAERIALVTGASSGIGLATARSLAMAGWQVACASRPSGKGAEAVERLRRETGSDRLHFLAADLSRPQQAIALADLFRERFGRLDALVNNAGAYVPRRVTTPEGFELSFALNHLGPFALTGELMELLDDSGGSVVTVSSDAARAARLQLSDPNSERTYNGWLAYSWSKLCNQLFTLALARRCEGSAVAAYAMHPGFVATSFGHAGGWLESFVRLGQKLFGRSPEEGADTVVWLVTSGKLEARNGGYYVGRRERPFARKARDESAQERLWEVSAGFVTSALADAEADGSTVAPAAASGVKRRYGRAAASP